MVTDSDMDMDRPAGGDEVDPWRAAVAAELFWIEETCSCATQCQTETARVWRSLNLTLGVLAILTSAVAGSMMLAASRFGVIAGGLALAGAMLTTLVAMVCPGRRENQAAEAGKAYEAVQALARQVRLVDLPGQSFEQARHALAELTERWQAVNRTALPVSRWAQVRAEQHAVPGSMEEAMTNRMSDVVSVFVPPPRPADQLSAN